MNTDETLREELQLWLREALFRCSDATRARLSREVTNHYEVAFARATEEGVPLLFAHHAAMAALGSPRKFMRRCFTKPEEAWLDWIANPIFANLNSSVVSLCAAPIIFSVVGAIVTLLILTIPPADPTNSGAISSVIPALVIVALMLAPGIARRWGSSAAVLTILAAVQGVCLLDWNCTRAALANRPAIAVFSTVFFIALAIIMSAPFALIWQKLRSSALASFSHPE